MIEGEVHGEAQANAFSSQWKDSSVSLSVELVCGTGWDPIEAHSYQKLLPTSDYSEGHIKQKDGCSNMFSDQWLQTQNIFHSSQWSGVRRPGRKRHEGNNNEFVSPHLLSLRGLEEQWGVNPILFPKRSTELQAGVAVLVRLTLFTSTELLL